MDLQWIIKNEEHVDRTTHLYTTNKSKKEWQRLRSLLRNDVPEEGKDLVLFKEENQQEVMKFYLQLKEKMETLNKLDENKFWTW